jgi:4a-hydroxytetrahydrobiopterin dehydratase
MGELSEKECIPCKGGIPPLEAAELTVLCQHLHQDWEVIDGHHLQRQWGFPDFVTALDFTNQAGAICEQQNHHADFELGWGRVSVKIWTHKIDGLLEADFILASKFDRLD